MVDVQRLEALRNDNKYSVKFIIEYLGYSGRNTYRRKLNNEIVFTLEDMIKLSSLYNCTIDSLIIKGEADSNESM